MAEVIHHGDCLEVMRTMDAASVDAVVCDPPYGLSFVGRAWDHGVPGEPFWAEALRVAKPGAHLLAFGGTRTHHRLACAIEDAGWEIRDCLMWVFGCLSDDTEILIEGRWERFDKATAGARALCYNPQHETFDWQPISEQFVYPHDEAAYRIVSDRTDHIVTRNHRILARRNDRWEFVVAEEAARECEVVVPVLEEVRDRMPESVSGGEAQAVRQVPEPRPEDEETSIGAESCSPRMSRMREASREKREACHASGDSRMQQHMQRILSRDGMGEAGAQGTRRVDGRIASIVLGEDERTEESVMEGWSYILPEARELSADQIRAMPVCLSSDGEEGWIRHGAPAIRRASDRAMPDADGSRSSCEPRSDGQSSGELGAILQQQGPQDIRMAWEPVADLARIEPVHYTGIVWCVTVPTGAFVARRNGKVFITGNSGFPKSHDVSKAIDRDAGATREVVRKSRRHGGGTLSGNAWNISAEVPFVTAPATPDAARWQGFGTALKPAYEPIILARKPLAGTVAANVLEHGTGALNIDGCRVPAAGGSPAGKRRETAIRTGNCPTFHGEDSREHAAEGRLKNRTSPDAYFAPRPGEALGRWPANLIHDGSDEVLAAFPETKSGEPRGIRQASHHWSSLEKGTPVSGFGDSGNASRFFKECRCEDEDLYFCRAKAMLLAWNQDLASTADNSSSLPSEAVASVVSDAAILALQGETPSNVSTEPSTSATPIELRLLCEAVITAILTTRSASWQGRRLDVLIPNGCRARSAEACDPTGTTTITINPLRSDGCAVHVTFGTMRKNSEAGAKDFARLRYCAKASKADREEGLARFAKRAFGSLDGSIDGSLGRWRTEPDKRANHHPTVKPNALMRYLCRLVTPPGGLILDPFAGSGSTGKAAIMEGFRFIGIEREAEYVEIARARIAAVSPEPEPATPSRPRQPDLFAATA